MMHQPEGHHIPADDNYPFSDEWMSADPAYEEIYRFWKEACIFPLWRPHIMQERIFDKFIIVGPGEIKPHFGGVGVEYEHEPD